MNNAASRLENEIATRLILVPGDAEDHRDELLVAIDEAFEAGRLTVVEAKRLEGMVEKRFS
jgi:hypothetical protein